MKNSDLDYLKLVFNESIHENSFVAAYDKKGGIIDLSQDYSNALRVSNLDDIYGVTVSEYLRSNDAEGHKFVRKCAEYITNSNKEMNDIYLNESNIVLSKTKPIITPSGQNIGQITQMIPVHNPMELNVNLLANLTRRYGVSGFTPHLINPIELNTLEEQIIFGLVYGYTLQEIANLINKSRIYVSKVISDSLCFKFNTPGYSSRILTEKLIELHFTHFIPKNLLYSHSLSKVLPPAITNTIHKEIFSLYLARFTYDEISYKTGYSKAAINKILKTKIQPLFMHDSNQSDNLLTYIDNKYNLLF